MRQASKRIPESAEKTVRDIRRATRRHHSAEEKIRIVLEALRSEDSIAELCRKEGINQNLYYRWSKEFLEAGKKRLAGDTARSAGRDALVRPDGDGYVERRLSPRRHDPRRQSRGGRTRVREVHDLLAMGRGLFSRFRVGDPGVARNVDREPLDGREEMKPARQLVVSVERTGAGSRPARGRLPGRWIDLHPGMQVSGRLCSTSMGRPARWLLVLALQQQVDRLSDEGRVVPVSRVRDHLPHPVPRRLIKSERDDQRLSNHSGSAGMRAATAARRRPSSASSRPSSAMALSMRSSNSASLSASDMAAPHSVSGNGCSRGTAFSSWASSKLQKCVGLRHRDPQPAANASTCVTLMIGRGSRASWASSHKARQRVTARSRLSGGFLTLPACSTRSSTWSSVYTWSIAARTMRSRSVDWQSCNPHPR
jgi:transposase